MQSTESVYECERDLVEAFCTVLELDGSPWGALALAREFPHVSGRTDIVALDSTGNVLAFEAKLVRWRDALYQAYRNTSFAHLSYVLLPEETAGRAQRHSDDFAVRSVGVCYMTDGHVVVSVPAKHQSPLQPWLSEAAATLIRRER